MTHHRLLYHSITVLHLCLPFGALLADTPGSAIGGADSAEIPTDGIVHDAVKRPSFGSSIRRDGMDALVGGAICACPLAGEDQTKNADLETPFLGAYLKFPRLFEAAECNAERERAIDAVLDRFRASGLNTVMPYVTSTAGTAVYPSEIIRGHQDGEWDPLAYLIAGARARQLAVYPVFCVLASGHDEPAGILREHPEWALRTLDGEPMGHISPTQADARHWVASVIAEVAEQYAVEGVLLDYLRYYNRPTRLDASSEAEFEVYRETQADVPKEQLAQRFREEALTELMRQISQSARGHNPELRIAIYSWGPHVARDHRVAQPWPLWSREGYIDMVNVSGYCYPDNYGDRYLDVFSSRFAARCS